MALSDLSFRHVTTKTWTYSGVFGFFRIFFRPNKTLPRPNHFLKIQWEIHFFTFFLYWPKLFKKKFRIEIWAFSFQICFQNQFSTSGSGQTENTQIRVFLVWPLPKADLKRECPFFYYKFLFWRVSVNIKKK